MHALIQHLLHPRRRIGNIPGCLCAALLLSLAPLCHAQITDRTLPEATDPSPWQSGDHAKGATNSITAGSLLIGGTAQAIFVAGTQIRLEPGFSADATNGATFRAYIAPAVISPSFSPLPATYSAGQTITLTTVTPGASIRYTTDGITIPTETVGVLYSGPIALSKPMTIEAVAFKPGFPTSIVVAGVYGVIETITAPAVPSPLTATAGTSSTLTSGGATSNLGHTVQYQFNWGDGTNSGWLPNGVASASHTWSTAGSYTVTVQARCAADISVTSTVSSGAVTVATPPPPDFTVTARSASQSVAAGTSAAYLYDVTALNGLDGATIGVVNVNVPSTPNCLEGWNQLSNWNAASHTGTVILYIQTTMVCASGFTYLPEVRWLGGGIIKTTTGTTLAINPATGFSLTVTPASLSVIPPASASYTVIVSGINATVNLGVSGLPPCASMTSAPASITGGSSTTFTIGTTGCPAGTSTITVTGTSSGYQSKSATAVLAIQAPSGPPIAATPSLKTITPGDTAGYTVIVGASAGFSGTVNLGASGLPAGATAAFNPPTVNNSGSSTLTVSTTSATPLGTFPITVWGQNGQQRQSTMVFVTVAAPSPATMISPASGSALTGSTATFAWDAGAGASQYQLSLGTTPGGLDIYQVNTGVGRVVSTSLPNVGQPLALYATLGSLISGVWQTRSYRYSVGAVSPQYEASASVRQPAADTTDYYIYNDNSKKTLAFCINAPGVPDRCDDRYAAALLSDCSVSGTGVTARLAAVGSDSSTHHASGYDVEFNADRTAQPGSRDLTCKWPSIQHPGTLVDVVVTAAVYVYDAAPKIRSLQQDSPASPGGPFYIEVFGANFGGPTDCTLGATGGTLAVCPAGAETCNGTNDISVSMDAPWSCKGDGQINALLTPSPNASGKTYDVQVVSRGINGSSFVEAPQGQTSQSNRVQVTVAKGTSMKLELLGTVISTDGFYSEDSTIRVTAVDSATGATIGDFVGTVGLAEDGTSIYSQNGGTLQQSVNISSGGTATFVAKSLAGPKAPEGKNGAPPDAALIKTTNYPVKDGASLSVPQWIISGAHIGFADPTKPIYDWFQYRIDGLFHSATGYLPAVLATVYKYSLNGGIDGGAETSRQRGALTSSVVFNPFYTRYRLDSAQGALCGLTASSHALAYALYHEARHAYQFSLMRVINGLNNDEDQDFLVNTISIAPTDIITDTTVPKTVCDEFANSLMPFTFKGPGSFDAYGDVLNHVPGVGYAIEMDAHKFASQQ